MNVKFKEVFNSPEDYSISKGEVLSKFTWNKKNCVLESSEALDNHKGLC